MSEPKPEDFADRSFEKTKLKKQLTQRKRGKQAGSTGAASKKAASETQSQTSTVSKDGFITRNLKKFAPASLSSSLTDKELKSKALTLAFFATSAFVIVKFGKQMNDMLQDYIPNEASIRKAMAEQQAMMAAQQQAMQMGGGMPPGMM